MTYYRHVEGKEKAKITLYTLSTCGWCRKTKTLLNELGLAYDYVDMDLVFEDDKREEMKDMLEKWNPACSFPTLVIDDESCIIGYKEDKIRSIAEK